MQVERLSNIFLIYNIIFDFCISNIYLNMKTNYLHMYGTVYELNKCNVINVMNETDHMHSRFHSLHIISQTCKAEEYIRELLF